jgi:phosphatidylglycerol:prolipoprotein diacylglycerol transferase
MVIADWIYHHDIDPFLIHFWNGIGIRWYGLAYLAGFLSGYLLLTRVMMGDRVQLSEEQAGDFLLVVALCGVVGGRVGYVFLYGWKFFLSNPFYLFQVWEGGMSIHGGVFGAILGIWWFAYRNEIPFLRLSDVAAFGTPPGLFFGRIANFINGELWGRPTGADWGVVFPAAPGSLPRHPSQLYEAVLEGPLLMGILVMIHQYTDDDGYLSSGFMIGYGVLRFLVEFYRAPDPHIGYELLGMTRGQEYSLIFIVIGILIAPGVRARVSTALYDAVVWTWK